MSGQRAQAPDSVSPARMGEYAAARANALYEAVQWAENEAYRLAEALDAMSDDPAARKRRTVARRIHKRLFGLLAPAGDGPGLVEDAYHANGGHDVPYTANPGDGNFAPAAGPWDRFLAAVRSGDDHVDDVLKRAGLSEEEA